MASKFHAMHYSFVAKRIREVYSDTAPCTSGFKIHKPTLEVLMVNFAHAFADDNELFDTDKFYSACMLPPSAHSLTN